MATDITKPEIRLCVVCLEETTVAVERTDTDERIWVCTRCGFIEVSGIDFDSRMIAPTDEELREITGNPHFGLLIQDLQREIRLGEFDSEGGFVRSIVKQKPRKELTGWLLWYCCLAILSMTFWTLAFAGLASLLD